MRLQFQESPRIFYWISILANVYIFLSQISSFFWKSQLDVGRANRYEADSVNLGKIEASADLEKNRKRACTVTNPETIAVEIRWNEARTRPYRVTISIRRPTRGGENSFRSLEKVITSFNETWQLLITRSLAATRRREASGWPKRITRDQSPPRYS